MALQVIGAGYPRTGTSSLKLALEQLGFGPCHHMREVLANPSSAALWVQAADGHPDWEAIFDGYRSCTDAPACTFWRELADYYPEAKVLLSVRDPDQWFESTQVTVFSDQMLGRLEQLERQSDTLLKEFFVKAVTGEFGEHIHDRDFMLARFERRKQEVIAAIPASRLLVYDVREGWEPLCAWLGTPAPDTSFPHANTREEMMRRRAAMAQDRFDTEQLSQTAKERFGRA